MDTNKQRDTLEKKNSTPGNKYAGTSFEKETAMRVEPHFFAARINKSGNILAHCGHKHESAEEANRCDNLPDFPNGLRVAWFVPGAMWEIAVGLVEKGGAC